MYSHMLSMICLIPFWLDYLPIVSANWLYKSRPDLSPPTLNITVKASPDVSEGYIFIAPYSWLAWDAPLPHGPLQPAPYIFTSTGDLIWSGFAYVSGWAGNFQTAKFNGEDVLFAFEGSRNALHGHSHGHVKILDKYYETKKEIRTGNHALLDLHEFHIVEEKTALVESYVPVPFDLKKYGAGPKSQWIVDARFQAVDIETGRLLFEWSSLEYVPPNESIKPISSLAFGTGHNSSDALDYFHINSVDLDSSNNYLISGRHTSTIYKIDGTTGKIIWRLGGQQSNFTLGDGVEFSLQHHARFVSSSKDEEAISLFDNSGSQLPGKVGDYINKSSGKVISLNTKTWTATLVSLFPAPDDVFAFSQGSTQILLNGNAFVNWGSAGAITEFTPEGDVIFHAYLESGDLWRNGDVQNYRGFRFNWTGFPNEEPAVVALTHGESTVIYVSWNGDTETKIWKFYGVDEEGEEVLLGEEVKLGFETSFYVSSGKDWKGFLAEAVGGSGKSLRKSKRVGREPYIYQYVPGRDDFVSRDGTQFVLERFEEAMMR